MDKKLESRQDEDQPGHLVATTISLMVVQKLKVLHGSEDEVLRQKASTGVSQKNEDVRDPSTVLHDDTYYT